MFEIKNETSGYGYAELASDRKFNFGEISANRMTKEMARYAIAANAEITRQAHRIAELEFSLDDYLGINDDITSQLIVKDERIAELEAMLPERHFKVKYEVVKSGVNTALARSNQEAQEQTKSWGRRLGNEDVRIVSCELQD